jgi:peptide/nickel transport system substrate-binding protein
MDEHQIRGMVNEVKEGRLSRRSFVRTMVGLGLTAPLAAQILMYNGVAQAQSASAYKPTKAGGGGTLKLLWWQGPTLLNPHFAVGTKDQDGSRLFYEPLAAWDDDGYLMPVLAAEIPSLENGGVAADGLSVTWKLKQGVTWHDGAPFTADDCLFNWKYASDPAAAAVTIASYKDVEVEKIDDHTIKVLFSKPTPFWADAFVGTRGCLIPKHVFEPYMGDKSRDAPANLAPIGTSPYIFEEFKPGDLVRGKINPNYHEANKPYFDAIEMKGGGDAVSAARAVLQTGEYDFAWNMQVEDEILKRLEEGGKGTVSISFGGNIEHMQLNNTDPWAEVDGERASLKTKHPSLSDPAVRQAINLLVDRQSVEDHIYGRTGKATANFLNNPERFVSKSTSFELNVDKAIKLLDDAGWKPGSDGIREKDGVQLKYVFQTSINQPRQKTQAIVKQACQKAGIEIEIKAVTASVYFSSDVGNPDTYTKFYTDLQMYTTTMTQPDPGTFMNQFVSWEYSNQTNKWQGRNITRWQNEEYDTLYRQAEGELDPVKRAALFVRMNELVIENVVVIPVVHRGQVSAVSSKLHAPMSGWDNNTWNLKDWFRES